MKKNIISYIFFILSFVLTSIATHANTSSQYVSVALSGQLGNQLFEIATAYAYSLDYNIPLTIPDLKNNRCDNIPYNAKKIFLKKISSYSVSAPKINWQEPSFNYCKIPFSDKIRLSGYFQSEKYFKHRRNEILELFEAPSDIQETILEKYPFLASDAFIVGIQIRDYSKECPTGNPHPTKKRAYYEEAMSYFPKDTLFLVSSNNKDLARQCTEGLSSKILYLHGEDYIEEFYTLVLCKSFIISNSSFGWWASWLSTAENKIVIAPDQWFASPYNNDVMKKDIFAEGTIILDY